MVQKFNEDIRVKIPAILTLTRLGYDYISLKDSKWDIETNIFTDIFISSLKKLNTKISDSEIKKLIATIGVELENEDLGRKFYERLIDQSGTKIIDFNNFENNTFNVVTELTCKNGDDEFRPDITLLINGLPLAFIEVKKPNNREGILAERNRINMRFANKKFRKFINISQLLLFSNNMSYDNNDIDPIQGAFYSTTSKSNTFFNQFREENKSFLQSKLKDEKEGAEDFILKDTNYSVIKNSKEYQTNKLSNTPTNSAILSLFSKERLKELLFYGLAYVEYTDDQGKFHLEKHIMRYPQFFATKAIEEKINTGVKKGIIWHTQGSGKTALAYFNVKYLTDYYQNKGIIPRFFFIVDRLDLKTQASNEFANRGLKVNLVDSRQDFIKEIKRQASESSEITVVNIHKFSDDSKSINKKDYNLNTQNIYFIDEAHRSYNPKGSFLANLITSDPDAIMISLTGTPLLGNRKNRISSRSIFGNYIHQYYYNQSIADGYTLRLIREDIETQYKMQLKEALDEIEIEKGSKEEAYIYSHPKFVIPMLDYIVNDLKNSRIKFGDDTIGGMVVCHSSNQAKELQNQFNKKYKNKAKDEHTPKTSTLILHDVEDKDFRKKEVQAFKDGNIDILFVFNMLLTGFDSPRLKKLYVNRQIKDHNLLQTLTRVNRPYKKFRYGFVVDFADIRKEFDKANTAYWKELQSELGDEVKEYNKLFLDYEDIEKEIANIRDKLWKFDTLNAENFSKQISEIEDKKELIDVKKALISASELFNAIRLSGHIELLEKLDFQKFKQLLTEVENRINLINLKENLESGTNSTSILNEALEDIYFSFVKISEAELKLADDFKDSLRRTREALNNNIDKRNPEWVKLKDRLKEIFEKHNFEEISEEQIRKNLHLLNDIYKKVNELNRKDDLLREKYGGDSKFVRIHNTVNRDSKLSVNERKIFEILHDIKEKIDGTLLSSSNVIFNEGYFSKLVQQNVVRDFKNNDVKLNPNVANYVKECIVNEYLNEMNGVVA
jgi:type I restriction enzyme, R subunit